MAEEEKRTNNKRGNKRLLRTLLMIALCLALVIVVQIGVVYWQGAQAGNNASLLLSAFNNAQAEAAPAASQSPSASASPLGTNTPEPEESPTATPVEVSQSDVIAAGAVDEHRLTDGSETAVDEGGDYVQPDMPTVDERDKIIAEVVSKVGEDGIIGVLSIPEINEELPVIGKWSYALLKISICRYKGPGANEKGNLVIVGHNYKNGSHFGNLDKLKVGSEVFLTDLNSKKVRYEVYEVETIAPTAFSKLDEFKGDAGLTLVTCIDSGSNRQVFRCEQKGN